MTEQQCIALKRKAFQTYFSSLNEQQQKAVFSVNGPVLVLAGAGSGKTTAIISRIVNMIYFGDGYAKADGFLPEEDAVWLQDYIDGKAETDVERLREILAIAPIRPWNILAITFTNKAAGEMRARLASTLGEEIAASVNASTFHSACVRILRRSITLLGYDSDFAIYDADDARRLMKNCLSDVNVSEKQFPPRSVIQEISRAKDAMISPAEMLEDAGGDYRKMMIAKLYGVYQQHLRASNALDFDDIIYLTVELFRRFPEELAKYQYRFPYVLVDEYQDTNHAQYQLISLLTHASGNLCVVGDDDQSIYRFRGATIENILGFEEEFPQCTVIRLEQNYRSTQNILDAANSVIANNDGRKSKHLWTDAGAGEKITWYKAADESDESAYVSKKILENVKQGAKYGDHAILYRMNAQSNMLERALVRSGVPYRIYGGTRFYDRKEIRDIIAYMSIVENPNDRVRFERIVNEPKRGIGDATLSLLQDITQDLHLSPLEVMRNADQYPVLSKKMNALKKFAVMWDELIEAERELPLEKFLDVVLEKTGYRAARIPGGDFSVYRCGQVRAGAGCGHADDCSFCERSGISERLSGGNGAGRFPWKPQPGFPGRSGRGTPPGVCGTYPCQEKADADYRCEPNAVRYDHAQSAVPVLDRDRPAADRTGGFSAAVSPWNFRRQAGIRAVYFAAAADGIGETTEIQGRAERIPCGRTGAPCNLWGRHCSGYHENGK